MEFGTNKRIRVLWFSNTDSGYNDSSNNKTKVLSGTWMSALVSEISKDKLGIDLGVVFKSNRDIPNKKTNSVSFFPVTAHRENSKVKKQINRIIGKIIQEDYIPKYLKIIDDFKPDIIHIFGSEQDFGLIIDYTDVPIVLSIQGNLTVFEWKYFNGVSKWQAFIYEKVLSNLLFLGNYNKYKLFRKSAKREQKFMKSLKYIIGRTDWDKRVASILAPNAKYYYNDEMLRKEFIYAKLPEKVEKNKFIISTVTRPALYKGLETVLKAAQLLDDIGFDFEWNIIGIDESDSLVRISRKICNCKADRINFLGSLTVDAIVKTLLKSDVYVMPSHIENGSIVLSEAMMLELPIITTLAGGTGSRLEDKKEGLVIQNGDPWSMAGAIIEFKSYYSKAVEFGKNARKKALKRHNPERIISDLLSIYKDIILKKP